MTHLSAGGLRSPASVGTARESEGASPGCVGTDPGLGLESAEQQHAGTNLRSEGAAILGSETLGGRQTE